MRKTYTTALKTKICSNFQQVYTIIYKKIFVFSNPRQWVFYFMYKIFIILIPPPAIVSTFVKYINTKDIILMCILAPLFEYPFYYPY